MGKELEKADKGTWLEDFADQRPDYFYPESWSDEKKAEAVELVRPTRMKTSMFASIPMTCQGKNCPVAEICPLLAKNLAPVGKPCPIEFQVVQEAVVAYMEELGVDPGNLVEVSMVRDLVDQEIQYLRTSKKLSLEDFIQEDVIGINENTGEPIFKKGMHIAVDLQDRIHKRKASLLKQLAATREQKIKAGQGRLDSAQVISDVFTQLREIELEQEKLVRRKLGIANQDDYLKDITDAQVIDE